MKHFVIVCLFLVLLSGCIKERYELHTTTKGDVYRLDKVEGEIVKVQENQYYQITQLDLPEPKDKRSLWAKQQPKYAIGYKRYSCESYPNRLEVSIETAWSSHPGMPFCDTQEARSVVY